MKKLLYIFFLIPLLFVQCRKEKRTLRAGEKMQSFIISIATYARDYDKDFIVIPQNGLELAFENLDPEAGLKVAFMAAIDGFGIEELFFDGASKSDPYVLDMAKKVGITKQIMIADNLGTDADVVHSINKCKENNFICFPRNSTNYSYEQIPDTVINENSNDVTTLNDAQNYLYLIGVPNSSSKSDLISKLSNTNFDVILIDLFYNDEAYTKSDIDQLKTKANGGKRLVISYMNIGAAESYRYYYKEKWKLHRPLWLKKPYDGYEDEIWVKFWKKDWHHIIYGNDESYTKKIIDAGFDGVYLDNVEAYYFLYHD